MTDKNSSAGEMFLIGFFLLLTSVNIFLFGRSFSVYEGIREVLGYSFIIIGIIAVLTARSIYKSL